jgi:hypothetical protein
MSGFKDMAYPWLENYSVDFIDDSTMLSKLIKINKAPVRSN